MATSITFGAGITIGQGIVAGSGTPIAPTNGSLLFSGSNYLSVAGGAGTAMGTGDFTWECWVYPTSSTGYQAFIDTRTSPLTGGDTTGFYFGTNINTLTPMYYTNGLQLASSVAMTLNAWNHVALTRASGTVKLWVNGALGGSRADSTNLTQQRVFIGGTSQSGSGTGLLLTGRISNLRMVKGTVIYTTTFTPAGPLTAVSGTQLLLNTTNDANFLKDSSTNNFTVTNNGTVTSSNYTPFTENGSILFPTSSYLASGTALTLGKTCTVEGWFRTTLNPASSKIVLVAGNGNRGISIYNGQYGQSSFSATKFTVDWEFAGNIEFTVPTMTANTWYHLAVTQTAAGVMTLWLNGTRSSTGTLTPNWTFQSQNYRIGGWQSQSIYSQSVYISNVRMTTTTVYDVTQTSITVPTAPLTAVSGTQLLLNTTYNANFLQDSSTNNITMTVTGSAASSALNPF